jgi:leader peptidase (prepilin peptidase)/N-methyltransferase
MALAIVLAAVGGLILGSFLNVVAYRLPRGESLVHPRSRCPQCATQLRAIDNVPVISWLALRGRCHHCGAPISARYPLVEFTTGALFAAVVATQDDAVRIVLGLLLVTALVPITLIDLDHQIIPNRIVAPGAVAALVLVVALDRGSLLEHAIAGAAAYFLLDVAAFLKPGGMGGGDVKLAGMLGLFLGVAVVPAVFIAFVVGSLAGGAIMLRHGVAKGRKMGIPFGPYLALGGVVGILAGNAIVSWYLHTFL